MIEPASGPDDVNDVPDAPEERLALAFAESFSGRASLLVRAPGRVNLLGEHTDYNDGFVLPMAIDRSIRLALRPMSDRRVVLRSLDFEETLSFDLDRLQYDAPGWIEYVKGTAWALQQAGLDVSGFEGVLEGQVPVGAGLSSSAALEIAAARAFAAVSGVEWDPVVAARCGQMAENQWVGVQCGIMDQLIVAAAREDHALLIDCRSLETTPCPLPPKTRVVILDTSTRRALVQSSYNDRRRLCEDAARLLGVRSLRDIDASELERKAGSLSETQRRLARHVVSENARTVEAAEAMRAADAVRLGQLMTEGHRSLRDDFGVSSKALDAMVASAIEAGGCHGARMTGAGFGGCVVALVEAAAVANFARAARSAYLRRTQLEASVYVCRPSAGVSLVAIE